MIPFRVDLRPGVSIYEQIVYAAKKAIISGQIRSGDPFPSVRVLSKELKINPNTAHKVVTRAPDRVKSGPSGRVVSPKLGALAPAYFFFGRYFFSIDATTT